MGGFAPRMQTESWRMEEEEGGKRPSLSLRLQKDANEHHGSPRDGKRGSVVPGLPTWAFPGRTQLLSQHQPFLGAWKPPRQCSILQVRTLKPCRDSLKMSPVGSEVFFSSPARSITLSFLLHHHLFPIPPEKARRYPDTAQGAVATSTGRQPRGGAALQHGSHGAGSPAAGAGSGFQHLAPKPFSQGAFEKCLKAQLPPTSARGPPRCGSGSLALLLLARATAGLAGKRFMLTGVDSL